MTTKPVFLTPEGLRKLEAELEHLRTTRRQAIAEKIREAKEFDTTVNNAEYEDAKNEQAFVEGRILTLEQLIKNASIINNEEAPAPWVRIGSKVTAVDEDGVEQQYTIVGSAEANPRDGKISNESPVGRALLGHTVGEQIEVLVPAGVIHMTLTRVE
ncbi:MAG: transcription elongation factor GreA [Chloroflexi bacterium]|nr:transcription elongation factor GreA [Chloroflexota bacterium]